MEKLKQLNRPLIVKKLIFYVVGLTTLGFGVNCVARAGLGVTPWDSFTLGLVKNVGLTMGTWIYIFGGVMLLLSALLTRKLPEFASIPTVLITGTLIDLWGRVFPPAFEGLALQIGAFSIGALCIASGCGIYLQAQFARQPIDALMMNLQKKLRISMALTRILMDAFAAGMGLILGGPVSVGTAILCFSLGPMILLCYKFFEKVFRRIGPTLPEPLAAAEVPRPVGAVADMVTEDAMS